MYGKNPRINKLIKDLKDLSREKEVNIWRDIAKRLNKPTKNYSEVNVDKINRVTEEGEQVIIPGKVLGNGRINKEVKIASLSYSKTAKQKIKEANGTPMTIEEMMESNPEGINIRIIG